MNDQAQSHPAPIKEDAMAQVREVFGKVLDTAMAYTQLSADFEKLRHEFSDFRQDMEALRRQNASLEETVAHSREARVRLTDENSELRSKLVQAERDRDMYKNGVDQANAEVQSLTHKLEEVRKDRDEAYRAWHESDDKLKQAQADLADIQGFAESFLKRRQPEPKPVEPKPDRMLGQPDTDLREPVDVLRATVGEASQPEPHPAPTPEPADAPTKADVDWNRPTRFNTQTREWENY